eukprot:1561371-Alexandrium_andersonii.AAC.1
MSASLVGSEMCIRDRFPMAFLHFASCFRDALRCHRDCSTTVRPVAGCYVSGHGGSDAYFFGSPRGLVLGGRIRPIGR